MTFHILKRWRVTLFPQSFSSRSHKRRFHSLSPGFEKMLKKYRLTPPPPPLPLHDMLVRPRVNLSFPVIFFLFYFF